MYVAPFEIAMFNGPPPEVTPYDVEVFALLLDTLVRIDEIQLLADPSIPLFHDALRAGLIHYVRPDKRDDPWRCTVSSLVAGEVDCEDAAAWRIAELRIRFGVNARPRFEVAVDQYGNRLIHVTVQLPNGEIEDPSKRAGMR